MANFYPEPNIFYYRHQRYRTPIYRRNYSVRYGEQNYMRWNQSWMNRSIYYENIVKADRGEVTVSDFLRYCIPPRFLLSYGYPVEFEKNRKLTVIYGTPKTDSLNTSERLGIFNHSKMTLDCYFPKYGVAYDNHGYLGFVSNNVYYIFSVMTLQPYYVMNNIVCNMYETKNIVSRNCVRCNKNYLTYFETGEYLTKEICHYHWGKLRQMYNQNRKVYICCGTANGAVGCTKASAHVWDGLIRGKLNGPFTGFVKTRPRPLGFNRSWIVSNAILGLDCEMCFTLSGFEACKVTIVNVKGDLVYNSFIQPEHRIIDYNTRFSGVKDGDLNNNPNMNIIVKSLKQVQADLLKFIHCETIVVGHGLENDLRVLKIVHKRIVDTAVVFPHYYGLPYRRSLKSLASLYLGRQIQSKLNGHDSKEDAKACLDLMVWKILNEKANCRRN